MPKQSTKPVTVINNVKRLCRSEAQKVFNTLSTDGSPTIHRLVHNEGNQMFLKGWWHLGRRESANPTHLRLLKMPREGLSPLGVLSILALAAGMLKVPFDRMVQSTRAPQQDAS